MITLITKKWSEKKVNQSKVMKMTPTHLLTNQVFNSYSNIWSVSRWAVMKAKFKRSWLSVFHLWVSAM